MRMRIDEFARVAGTTSRNVRAYQARGLLPPPALEGRTGYYGEEHLRRIELIDELQARGFSLEAIRHTLDAWAIGGDLAHIVGLRHVLAAPITDEEPADLTADELLERFPEVAQDATLIDRAVELGLIEPAGEGVFRVPSPILLEAGTELGRIGVSLSAVFELVEAIRPDITDIAERFVGLVHGQLVGRLLDGERETGDLGETIDAVRRLKPIALEVVRAFLADALQEAIQAAAEDTAARLGEQADGLAAS